MNMYVYVSTQFHRRALHRVSTYTGYAGIGHVFCIQRKAYVFLSCVNVHSRFFVFISLMTAHYEPNMSEVW